MPIDTKGSPDGAEIAAQEAVAAGVELVIGPVFRVRAACAPNTRRWTEYDSFFERSVRCTTWCLSVGASPETQIDRVVRFMSLADYERLQR